MNQAHVRRLRTEDWPSIFHERMRLFWTPRFKQDSLQFYLILGSNNALNNVFKPNMTLQPSYLHNYSKYTDEPCQPEPKQAAERQRSTKTRHDQIGRSSDVRAHRNHG